MTPQRFSDRRRRHNVVVTAGAVVAVQRRERLAALAHAGLALLRRHDERLGFEVAMPVPPTVGQERRRYVEGSAGPGGPRGGKPPPLHSTATHTRATLSSAGSSLPRFAARRRMPRHAVGESQYFDGAFGSKIRDKEDPTSSLGHGPEPGSDAVQHTVSDALAVQDSPRNVQRPEVCQFRENSSEISPSDVALGGLGLSLSRCEAAGDVLPEDKSRPWTKPSDDPDRFAKESAPFVGQPAALAGHGEPLARRAEHDHVDRCQVALGINLPHVAVAGGPGPMARQHRHAIAVDFNLPRDLEAGRLEAQIEAAGPAEQASDARPTHDVVPTSTNVAPRARHQAASTASLISGGHALTAVQSVNGATSRTKRLAAALLSALTSR
jgi:hypothetical protein